MARMTQLEAQLIQKLIEDKVGMRAGAGNLMDMAGTALGFVDNAVTPQATRMQNFLVNNVGKLDAKYPAQVGGVLTNKGKVLNMLGSSNALSSMKIMTGLGAVGGVLGAADVIAGQDSLGNKAMDTAAMGIGGFLGAAGGPVGIAAGAGTGKMISDATQWIFGDKKTADQRKLEEALAMLNGGRG